MIITKRIVFILMIIPFSVFNQAPKTNDGKEAMYNIGIGALIGGVGALINKNPEQNWSKVLLKGISQGALGGYLSFESKRIIRYAEPKKDYTLIWSSKILNACGTSIKDNAASNQDFWTKGHINIGFSRIEFSYLKKLKINYKIMPVALFNTIWIASQSKFEFKSSIKTGQIIFSNNKLSFFNSSAIATTFPGSIVLLEPIKTDFKTISHEIIHIYQANDFSPFDSFFNKPLKYINTKSNFLYQLNKFIYYDFRYLPEVLLYNFEMNRAKYYYDNKFEKEAGFYSNSFDANMIK
ncbi:MAG: hypothetical protein HYU67_03160 [Flavobacteriia bacterium]|nr:hypothetical protein [Flavobacteriia bacterium]